MNSVNDMNSGAGNFPHARARARLREEGSYRSHRSCVAEPGDGWAAWDSRFTSWRRGGKVSRHQPVASAGMRIRDPAALPRAVIAFPLASTVGHARVTDGFSTSGDIPQEINRLRNAAESGPGFERLLAAGRRPCSTLAMARDARVNAAGSRRLDDPVGVVRRCVREALGGRGTVERHTARQLVTQMAIAEEAV